MVERMGHSCLTDLISDSRDKSHPTTPNIFIIILHVWHSNKRMIWDQKHLHDVKSDFMHFIWSFEHPYLPSLWLRLIWESHHVSDEAAICSEIIAVGSLNETSVLRHEHDSSLRSWTVSHQLLPLPYSGAVTRFIFYTVTEHPPQSVTKQEINTLRNLKAHIMSYLARTQLWFPVRTVGTVSVVGCHGHPTVQMPHTWHCLIIFLFLWLRLSIH